SPRRHGGHGGKQRLRVLRASVVSLLRISPRLFMNLSAIAVKRPVFTVMVTVALLVLGGLGLSRLGTDLFPDVSFPVVSVNIVYPGASPNEVENQVSKPIEDAVVSLSGIDRVMTYSREGLSTTIIFFKLGVDIQEAATQARE